jgi:hypothetical protein
LTVAVGNAKVGVGVMVGVCVSVGVSVMVGVKVGVNVSVNVGLGVKVKVDVGVDVRVLVDVSVHSAAVAEAASSGLSGAGNPQEASIKIKTNRLKNILSFMVLFYDYFPSFETHFKILHPVYKPAIFP